MKTIEVKFWNSKKLDEMNYTEWEIVCDNCGQCCFLKAEDYETGEIYKTNVICEHYDLEKSRCSSYNNRHKIISNCTKLTPKNLKDLEWLPDTCAYIVLDRGMGLPTSHPLVSCDSEQKISLLKSKYNDNVIRNHENIDLADHIIK